MRVYFTAASHACMHATCIADDTNNAEVTRVPAGLSLRARGPDRETVRVLPEEVQSFRKIMTILVKE